MEGSTSTGACDSSLLSGIIKNEPDIDFVEESGRSTVCTNPKEEWIEDGIMEEEDVVGLLMTHSSDKPEQAAPGQTVNLIISDYMKKDWINDIKMEEEVDDVTVDQLRTQIKEEPEPSAPPDQDFKKLRKPGLSIQYVEEEWIGNIKTEEEAGDVIEEEDPLRTCIEEETEPETCEIWWGKECVGPSEPVKTDDDDLSEVKGTSGAAAINSWTKDQQKTCKTSQCIDVSEKASSTKVHTTQQPVSSTVRVIILKKCPKIRPGMKPYECDVCHAAFFDHGSVEDHKKIHTSEQLYKCDVCKYMFKTARTLQIHKRFHCLGKRYLCNVRDARIDLASLLSKHRNIKSLQCGVCYYKCRDISDLGNHMITHNREKPYKCNVCCCSFLHINSLKRHKLIHSGENNMIFHHENPSRTGIKDQSEPAAPDQTGKESAGVSEAAMTVEDVPSGAIGRGGAAAPNSWTKDQQKTCSTSRMDIYQKASSTKVHTTQQPVSSTVSDSKWVSIMNKYPKIRPAAPYHCDVCNEVFFDYHFFEDHKRIHAVVPVYKCSFCERVYRRLGDLNRHKSMEHHIVNKKKGSLKFHMEVDR